MDKDKYSKFPIRNYAGEKIVEQALDGNERKLVNLEFYRQRKYL